MRPPVPDACPPRSRKSSFEQSIPPRIDPRNAVPATFFLTRNHDQDDDLFPDDSDGSRGSMYGVQSLEETVQQASLIASHDQQGFANPFTMNKPQDDSDEGDEEELRSSRRRSTLKPFDMSDFKSETSLRPSFDLASSRPLTPPNLNNPDDDASLPSSPKSISNQSLKPLDEISITDDLSSQAIASGEEDEESRDAPNPGPDDTSQLIMPSIKMPSRRPFTERGKAMGRFKILITGAPGSGKTSLVRSIVQACEDIVHVDPFPSPDPFKPRRSSRSQARDKQAPGMTTMISEIYASTKPYPPWWSDLEDSRVLRRKKSMGDIVLERNLCFVDTPGNTTSREGQTDAIVQYMHQQLFRATSAFHASSVDFQNLLAGNGGSQVDAILYLISEDTLTTDLQCIQKLCEFSNVIPVISKADLLSSSQISSLKWAFHKHARRVGIKPFLFNTLPPDGPGELDPQSPFAVSSAKSNDDDNMDASILMSPDYVQPLVPSELSVLIQNMFDRDNVAWLRHSAARKIAQARGSVSGQEQQRPQRPTFAQGGASRLSSSIPSLCSSDGFTSVHAGGSASYTMARLVDYTQHEEKLAQVQLAKWASDLQRSLRNERERYAALAKGERAIWLTERLSECVVDGTLVPIAQTPGFCGLHVPTEKASGGLLVRTRNGQQVEYRISNLSPHDPLGVVWWTDDLKRRGWAIVQVVGSFGVVGGLALWLAKTWGLPSRSLSEWNFDWVGTHH